MTRRQIHLTILILIIGFIILMELGFRAYLFKQSGIVLLIAGSLPNFIAVIFFAIVFVIRKDEQQGSSTLKMVALAVIAMVIYELVQPLIPGRVIRYIRYRGLSFRRNDYLHFVSFS